MSTTLHYDVRYVEPRFEDHPAGERTPEALPWGPVIVLSLLILGLSAFLIVRAFGRSKPTKHIPADGDSSSAAEESA